MSHSPGDKAADEHAKHSFYTIRSWSTIYIRHVNVVHNYEIVAVYFASEFPSAFPAEQIICVRELLG